MLTIIACLPMAIYLILFKPERAMLTLLTIAIAAIIYFISLYIIDAEARKLIKKFIEELSQRFFLLG
jgi:hypothetical protein